MMKAVVEATVETGVRKARADETGAGETWSAAHAGEAHPAAHGVHAAAATMPTAAATTPSAMSAARERGRRKRDRRGEHGGYQASHNFAGHLSLLSNCSGASAA
jgi:hypothetical protein